jgi:hypothetical protein
MTIRATANAVCGLLAISSLFSPALAADLTDLAINKPDEFSWTLFTQLASPFSSSGSPVKGVTFESWATNDDTFTNAPTFPTSPKGPTELRKPALFSANAGAMHPMVMPNGGEEVRRNRAGFDFIVNNNLHTRPGLIAAFQSKKKIDFPIPAIEIKAIWLSEFYVPDPTQYYINVANGKRYVLIALHIISKQLPNWTWATFEHQNTPGRCDFTGCNDAFGATEPKILPLAKPGQLYGSCKKSKPLLDMFADAKLDAAWANYCLKGSQTDFTDSTGVPTQLGNSVIEAPFIQTSSCITCHARSATNAKGANVFGFGSVTAPCPDKGPCSPRGAPNPAWFWSKAADPDRQAIAAQTDFVWSVARCAIPRVPGECR